MDESTDLKLELVHLARLALSGRAQDIHHFVRRLSKRIRSLDPVIADQLDGLLRESPSRAMPFRNDHMVATPVDQDSRLQLIRHEFPVVIDSKPIWSNRIRDRLSNVVAERNRETELRTAGLSPTRSVLLTGPPGVGKTLSARWIASKLNRPLFNLDLSAVMSSFLGRTGVNVRYVLDYAKGIECVLLLDEFDAIAKRRDDSVEIGELKRLVTVLLQEIDDWPATGILVAATNHPKLLDPAVWRRFDMVIEFEIPTNEQVGEAVNNLLGAVDVRPASLEALSIVFQGSSFSDIEREILRVRRESLMSRQPIGDCLVNMIREHAENLTSDQRRSLALSLSGSGLSQRDVNRFTGVSRDTLRKMAIEKGEN